MNILNLESSSGGLEAILNNSNVRKKEYKRLKKYQELKEEGEKMWKVEAKV